MQVNYYYLWIPGTERIILSSSVDTSGSFINTTPSYINVSEGSETLDLVLQLHLWLESQQM